MDNYAQHLFRGAVAEFQANAGMADRFAHAYRNRFTSGLGPDEQAFTQACTTAFIATTSEDGWPYVQHRGGPPGFLKVLDTSTLAFADYPGNKQFISQGHLKTKDKISLILMDFARQARLKMIGTAAMVEAAEDPDLAARLSSNGAPTAERLVTIQITAIDWNCPKYITPRFTEAEIEQMLAPRMARINDHITALEARLTALDPNWKDTP